MEDQFLALKKSKNRALGQADTQEDMVIDLRDFYPSGLEEDEHFHQAFILRHKKSEQEGDDKNVQVKNKNKKRKYI